MTELLIAERPCSECLTSKNRIVCADRAAELEAGCRASDTHFQCHKGTLAGLNVHCAGVRAKTGPCLAERFARAAKIPVRYVDPDQLQPAPRWRPADTE